MQVADTFSLKGFNAAYAAIVKACPPGKSPMSAALDLTEAERARILAKTARFAPPPARLADGRRDLVGLSRDELAAELAAIGEAPFRAKQLWHWIYHQGATDFSRMSTIARPLQQKLAEHFVLGRPEADVVQTSEDGTRKFLFRFRDGQEAETVYIPDRQEDRGAVCISSPGRLHAVLPVLPHRHAGAGAQPRRGRDRRPVHGRARQLRRMAEPEGRNAAPALHHRADGHGRAAVQLRERRQGDDDRRWTARASRLSRRRITLSTSGVVPMMDRAGAELGVNLAVSLHAVRDDLRDELVPLNRKYPIAELIAACRRYPVGEQRAAHHLRIRHAERHQR